MNRTRRKAAKMFRRKYGKATHPFWQKVPVAATSCAAEHGRRTDQALRSLIERDKRSITFNGIEVFPDGVRR